MLAAWELQQPLAANASAVASLLWFQQKSSGDTAGPGFRQRSDQSRGGSSRSVAIARLLNHTSLPAQET